MNSYDWNSIKRIKQDLYFNGIEGSKIKGELWKNYSDLAFNIPTWDSLDKDDKFILLRSRQLLIKKDLSKEEIEEFISLNEEIELRDLDLIDWPLEYNTFEKFIINLILEKEFSNEKYSNARDYDTSTQSHKRKFDRRRRSIFS